MKRSSNISIKRRRKFASNAIIIILLAAMLLVGCSETEYNPESIVIDESVGGENNTGTVDVEKNNDISDLIPSEYAESDFDTTGKVSFKTEYTVIDNEMESISYTIENLSGEELEYGEEYVLEIKADDKWYQVPFPENYGWNAVAHILPDGGISGDILNLAWMDFEYVDGEYRIVKRIGNYLVRAEFSMGESKITPDMPFGYENLENLPISYTLDEAIEDNVVVLGYQKSYNLDCLKTFVNNVKIGLPAMVRFGFSTIEGDPIFYDLIHNATLDGREWYTLHHDSRRDEFSAEDDRIITKNNFSYIVTDGMNIYFSNFAEYSDTELFYESSRDIYAGEYLTHPELVEAIADRWEDVTIEELQEEIELYEEIIAVIEEMTANRLEWNVTRYKSFSPEGTYYVSLNEEQLARINESLCSYPLKEDMNETKELNAGPVSFGFGTKGYGTSDYGIVNKGSELIKQTSIIGVETVSWIDDETAILKCATMHEGVHYNINFYPAEAINNNHEAAFGEWEYIDNSNK